MQLANLRLAYPSFLKRHESTRRNGFVVINLKRMIYFFKGILKLKVSLIVLVIKLELNFFFFFVLKTMIVTVVLSFFSR